MINHEAGIYVCDYCGGDFGIFDTATGNHSQCAKLAAKNARIKELEEAVVDAQDKLIWASGAFDTPDKHVAWKRIGIPVLERIAAVLKEAK